MNDNILDQELGWEDEIENEGSPRRVLEPGEYPFTVLGFERARYAGSEKVAPCNQAILHLRVDAPDGESEMNVNLFLLKRFEWKLCQFFTSIGLRQHGEKLRMNWAAVTGKTGRCRITKRTYKDKTGADRETNDLDEFLDRWVRRPCSRRAALRREHSNMELRPRISRRRVKRSRTAGSRDDDSTLLSIPTGCGKTVIFAKIAEDRVRQGDRVLILAHRGELLDQAADKLHTATGLSCATEKAEQSCLGSWLRVAVGSVQTLMRPKRLAAFPRDYFGTIIIDEAHHAVSDSYGRILNHFDSAKVLGVTATPDRGDMRNLGSVFQSLAYEYSLTKAIREGYLVPIKALTVPLKMDLSGVGVQSGDFKPGDLDSALDPYLYQIADEMAKTCADRKTVVFLPLVKTSQKFRDILCSRGFRAAEVNGESPDRAEILAAFDRGEYNVLCNSMLLTEGWDCPSRQLALWCCARLKYAACTARW